MKAPLVGPPVEHLHEGIDEGQRGLVKMVSGIGINNGMMMTGGFNTSSEKLAGWLTFFIIPPFIIKINSYSKISHPPHLES